MLIVKLELHSALTGEVTTMGTGKIINDGTGTPSSGNYRIEFTDHGGRLWKSGVVTDFPRKRLLGWDLLTRALCNVTGERNCPRTNESSPGFGNLKRRISRGRK